jgi:hypothetical protein
VSIFEIETFIRVSIWRALKFRLFGWKSNSNSRRQSKNIEMKYKTHIKLVHELYSTCFEYNVRWIKTQPSNCTSYSDNALHLLVLVTCNFYWELWGCVSKGCFERGIFSKSQIAFEGHWRLQSRTLVGVMKPNSGQSTMTCWWVRLVDGIARIQLPACSLAIPQPVLSF